MYRMQKLSKEVEEDRAEGISSPLVNKIGELKVAIIFRLDFRIYHEKDDEGR